jgi:uncharacterized protein (DUF2236 family)
LSIADRINAERLVLLGWSRAILLQMAHPLIAAGVANHSSFRASPVASARRLHQTVRAMLGLTFGTEAERGRVMNEIRAIHRRVHGTLREQVGRFPAGTRYSAEDPSLLLWVHATLIESAVIAYEAVVAGLAVTERDTYCRDAADVAIALGARPEEVPRDWASLTRYLCEMHRSGTLAIGPDAHAIGSAVLRGRLSSLAGPIAWANRLLTTAWLPSELRAQYGLRWSAADERHARQLLGALPRLRKALPAAVALWPEARRQTH